MRYPYIVARCPYTQEKKNIKIIANHTCYAYACICGFFLFQVVYLLLWYICQSFAIAFRLFRKFTSHFKTAHLLIYLLCWCVAVDVDVWMCECVSVLYVHFKLNSFFLFIFLMLNSIVVLFSVDKKLVTK